jgi:hypothetical protein
MAGSIRTAKSIGKLTRTSNTTLTLATSRINIGALQWTTSSILTLTTSVIGAGGVDVAIQASSLYYIYAVIYSGAVYLIGSLNATSPGGFSQAAMVGGFTTDSSSNILIVGDISNGSFSSSPNVIVQGIMEPIGGTDLGPNGQTFIDQSSTLTAQNSTTGYPSPTGTFYSTVIGRAAIPDITNDFRASLGIERIQTQQSQLIQNEQGPNGESIFGVVNDDRGLIRFVGTWSSYAQTHGPLITTGVTGDYIEITFYGTGLNALLWNDGASRNFPVTLDGSAYSSPIVTGSTVLFARNYPPNVIWNLVSGQTLGLHTVKITNNASVMAVYGFEILNSNASGLININPGTAYSKGTKYINSAVDSIAYNKDQAGTTVVTGAKGGRIVRAITANDTISTYWQAVDASIAYGNSASHANEEVARVYMPREFGAGRYNATYANQDDFSLMTTTARQAAFTLDDGTTTLLVSGNTVAGGQLGVGAGANPEGIWVGSNNQSLTFTFVGCGLDALLYDTASGSDSYTYNIDGGSNTAWFYSSGSTSIRTQKIVSGLPYGTHTFTFNRITPSLWSTVFVAFKVYQPKKPALPVGAVEICDYNIMGNYVSGTSSGIGTGLLRKSVMREFIYVGTWSTSIDVNAICGFWTGTLTTGDYAQYTFFGTGFEYRFTNPGLSVSTTFTLTDSSYPSGTSNFSSFTTGYYGSSVTSFTASTGVLVTNTGGTYTNGIYISGLALGWHTIKIAKTAGTSWIYPLGIDIITPIHVHKHNLYATLQNTLAVGSQSLNDSRQTTSVATSNKAWAQAVGVTSVVTTSSSYVPLADMSVTIKTSGGPISITGDILLNAPAGASGAYARIVVYVDGVQVTRDRHQYNQSTATFAFEFPINIICPVAAGIHKVDVFWNTSGVSFSANADANANRMLTVREL